MHNWRTPIPGGAFHAVAPEVYVSSPEFLFVQLASTLEVTELVALGLELCGGYAQSDSGDIGVARSLPLATVERLARSVDETPKSRGHSKALRAMRYIVDGSNCASQSLTFMLLCLPPLLGGYGIPNPGVMDMTVRSGGFDFTAEYGDQAWAMLWPESHFCVICPDPAKDTSEVGGRTFYHVDISEETGYFGLVMPRAVIYDLHLFEETAMQIAHALGKRLRSDILGSTTHRMTLRRSAFYRMNKKSAQ